MLLMGTAFAGDVGGSVFIVVLFREGDGVRGKVSAMLFKVDDVFAVVTATKLLYLDGIIGGSSSISCLNGVAVPIGIKDFAIDVNGRYGATDEIGLVTVVGGDGMWLVGPDEDIPTIPFANFSKFKKSSLSFVVRRERP